MRHPREGRPGARHTIAGLEQRYVVCFAVVSNQYIETGQIIAQTGQQGGLVAKIAHEKLADPESLLVDAAHSDQESVRACAARQSRSLRVEKSPALRMRPENGSS